MTSPSGSSATPDRSNLSRHTLDRVNEGLQSGKTAGIAEIIQLVHALSANALDISVQELAELIEKDVTVTAKVLSAANTLGYNPAAQHVTTISEAIQTIGFNKVRMLAMSLMLMETAERTLDGAERREASMLAVSSGMVAQAWAEETGRSNPEQAFVCASLRNFGKLLLTTFLMDDYRRAQELAANFTDGDAAYRATLGLTPLELGYELLKSASLPPPLLQTLKAFSPKMLEAAALDSQTELLVASEFSMRLSELTMNHAVDPEKYQREIEALCGRFQKHLGVSKESVANFLERTQTRLSSFGQAFGMAELGKDVAQRFSARSDGRPLPPRVIPAATKPATPSESATATEATAAPVPGETGAGATKSGGGVPAPVSGASGSPAGAAGAIGASSPESSRAAQPVVGAHDALFDPTLAGSAAGTEPVKRELAEVLQDAIAKLGEMIARPDLNAEAIAATAAEELRVGWEADEAVVFVERTKGSFAPFAGSGERWRSQKLKMSFKREERSVLGVATTRGEPVLIHEATDPKIGPYLPPWFRAGLDLFACAIIPAGGDKAPPLVAFVGWRTRRKVLLSAGETRSIRALLGLIGTARRLSGS